MGGGGGPGEGFERVFDLVGGHGRFQWRLLFILALQVCPLWRKTLFVCLGK